MTSKERICAAWRGETVDHIPLTTWCFGFSAPAHLAWKRRTEIVRFWYSRRMQHIHTIPEGWDLEDEFNRVLAWQSVGVDDVIDVSVPWSASEQATWTDRVEERGEHPVFSRRYRTPAGILNHRVAQTKEHLEDGWVRQPGYVPIFEDFNIPRGVDHAVSSPEDVPKIPYLYCSPNDGEKQWFESQMVEIQLFANKHHVPVQAWSAYGMDAVVWLTGAEGAVLLAVDHPEKFSALVDCIARTDRDRTELAARHPGVDMIVQRGWYSSTDFWSPRLFDEYVFPGIAETASIAHKHGKLFAYVMTTGVETLGLRLVEAGVDVLYFIDPVQDTITLEKARDLLGGKIALVGGINALSLASGDTHRIEQDVKHAIDVLGPTNRFILHPLDALFPDTRWESVNTMIKAWRRFA